MKKKKLQQITECVRELYLFNLDCLFLPSGWIFDVSGDFRYVLYIVATCSVTGGLIMGIGSYVTSHERDTSAQAHGKENSARSKTTDLKHLRLFGIKTVLPDEPLLSAVVYESTV